MNQFDFFKRFPTKNDAIDFIVETKYKDGYVCPKCGCTHNKIYHQRYNRRNLYCNNCKCEFSALTGTIFEHIHLDIRMWLFAINLVLIACKSISGLQLQRELGMKSYKGAFRMMKLIRAAMGTETHKDAFEAIVEIDETYVGGKPRKENTHKGEKTKKSKRGRRTSKTPVVGALDSMEIDVYIPDLRLGFEFNGDFWHMNPEIYEEDAYNTVTHMTAGDTWKRDKRKSDKAALKNIVIVTIWESEWKSNRKHVEEKVSGVIREIGLS